MNSSIEMRVRINRTSQLRIPCLIAIFFKYAPSYGPYLFPYLIPNFCLAQNGTHPDSFSIRISSLQSSSPSIPAEALQAIQVLDFKNTEIKDIVRGLATKYNLNVFVDDAISQRITLRLANLSVHEALRFIAKEHGLNMTLEGNIYKITLPEIPKPLAVSYEDGRLTVDVKDEEAEKVIRAIAEKSRKSLVLKQSAGGKITGYLQAVPFEPGLQALLTSNGFAVRKKDEIYFIERNHAANNGANSNTPQSGAWVTVSDSLITLDVMDVDLNWVVRELSTQMGKEVFIYGALAGKVNAQCSALAFDQVLDYVFKGTNYTYRREGKVYFIGDKNLSGIASTQLVRLKHIKATTSTSFRLSVREWIFYGAALDG